MAKIRQFLRPPRQEQGQAMVFVVLFLPVIALSLVFLYKAGRITSEKMELQNAADAAAFSISVVEARDLNYMAYTNRAMIANEVAIGQLVGLASWARHWKGFYDYMKAYDTLVLSPITFGVSTPIVEAFAGVIFKAPGEVFSTILGTIAKVGTQVLSMMNKVFGASQTGFHIVSILYAVSTLDDIIDRNAPDAKLSPFGLLALVAHAYTFGVVPGVALPGLPEPMVTSYSATSVDPGDQDGMKNFAALVNQSRDEFTTKRGWEWLLELIDVDESLCVFSCGDPIYFEMNFRIYFAFEFQRLGGSELRYVGDDAAGNKFNWSAADTTDVGVLFDLDISAKAVVDLGPLGTFDISLGGLTIDFGSGKASLSVCIPIPIPGFGCIDVTLLDNIDFPTALPFSAAAYQAGPTGAHHTDVLNDDPPLYGDAPENFIAWKTGIPPTAMGIGTPGVGLMYQAQNKSTTYKGIPRYNATNAVDDPWGFQAPYILIGLTKDLSIIEDSDSTRGPTNDPLMGVKYGDETDELGVLAKAEVYFARPNDLSYFRRADDYQEYGNAFNPYWQARLVSVTYADEVVGLLAQQGEEYSSLSDVLNLPSWLPTDMLP